jgi:hypothetical protein
MGFSSMGKPCKKVVEEVEVVDDFYCDSFSGL